ncbi:hypothetical protein KKF91_14065 [Myxococcota bacterium]|nr:hypothetical protein [Myxococcota bacterium]MBU1431665.1 hypothetical protein [Myxococcota bacterium]MBU1898693.1 hypothetical protein [Myxococcota bacterium]
MNLKKLSFVLSILTISAGMVFMPSYANAERPRVQRVEKHRYKCTWSDGSFTHTTAGNRQEARKNCEAMSSSQAPGVTLTGITDESRAMPAKAPERAVTP